MKKKRKTYSKPVVTKEKIFETAALACGKCTTGNPTQQLACQSLRKLS